MIIIIFEQHNKYLNNNTIELTYPVTTTKKSMMFQMFLRYEPLCKTKPKARIFKEASTQNIAKKYFSVLS